MDVLRALVREVIDDRVNGLAAEIAFFGILGVFPGLLMLVAALGWLDALAGQELADQARGMVVTTLDQVLTEDAGGALSDVRDVFTDGAPGLLTTAMLASLWALSRSFAALIVALDLAYDLEERRPWWQQRLTGLGLAVGTVLMVALVLGMVVVGPLLGGGKSVADSLGLGAIFAFAWTWLRWPFAFGLVVVWAATVFDLGPAVRTSWHRQLPGAVFVAAAWLVVSAGFSAYLHLAGGGNPVYGVLGGGLIVLLWLYLLSAAFLVGAELNAVLGNRPVDIEHERDAAATAVQPGKVPEHA